MIKVVGVFSPCGWARSFHSEPLRRYISRKDALAIGFPTYFTGVVCRNGHVSARRTIGGDCVSCMRELSRRRYLAKSKEIKERVREYQHENREKIKLKKAKHRLENREELLEKQARYRAENKEKIVESRKRHYEKNKDLYVKWKLARKERTQMATPPWHDAGEVRKFYDRASELTKTTGIPHEVDHIVPLRGKYVSGLHVHQNLQVIPRSDNRSKSNKFNPDTYGEGDQDVSKCST